MKLHNFEGQQLTAPQIRALVPVISLCTVQRKLKAAVGWCDRINALEPAHRNGLPWHYVLLAESVVHEWQAKGAHLAELLGFARLRPLANAFLQERLI